MCPLLLIDTFAESVEAGGGPPTPIKSLHPRKEVSSCEEYVVDLPDKRTRNFRIILFRTLCMAFRGVQVCGSGERWELRALGPRRNWKSGKGVFYSVDHIK